MIKIAIVKAGGFSQPWIKYCELQGIDYKVVNPYDENIVDIVKSDCSAFMWHHHHSDYRDNLFAKQLIFSLEEAGIKCFPSSSTTWHFDDKVGQKYLLESIGAPLVPSHVFYTKKEALLWIEKVSFPKVFKLRGGAGSSNVRLVESRYKARRLVNKSFSSGFSPSNHFHLFVDSLKKFFHGYAKTYDVAKYSYILARSMFIPSMLPVQKGYVYFQDFIENNDFDIRVVVIANRAFAIKRMVRKNDFRASGSGNIKYDRHEINEQCVKIAFEVGGKLKLQCVAMDFVFKNERPLIVEMSYGFSVGGYTPCPGYWTSDMKWHEEKGFDFCGWMVETVV